MPGMTAGGEKLAALPDIEEVEPVSTPRIPYPSSKLDLWSCEVSKGDRLEVVNEEDFPHRDLLSNLKLIGSPLSGGFGTANYQELAARRQLLELLVRDSKFRRWVLGHRITGEKLPANEGGFFRFYDNQRGQHNPYWQQIYEFCAEVREAEKRTGIKSSRLDQIVAVLEQSGSLEEAERQMAAVIAERIEHIAAIGGVMTYTVSEVTEKRKTESSDAPIKETQKISVSLTSQQAYGYLRFSATLARLEQIEQPKWQGFWGKLGSVLLLPFLVLLVRRLAALFGRYRAMRSVVLAQAPPELASDLRPWVEEQLWKLVRGGESPFRFDGCSVKVAFRYDQDGLTAMIYGLEPDLPRYFVADNFLQVADNKAYNAGQKRVIAAAKNAFDREYQLNHDRKRIGLFWVELAKLSPDIFSQAKVASPSTDGVCRWYALANLYYSSPLRNAVKACLAHREFFGKHIRRLQEVASMVDKVRATCHDLQLPLCVAEPLPSHQHLIEFDGIMPVHLLDQLRRDKKTPTPFSLPPLNGEMICMTGSHGGGKTTALLSVLVSLYMAQSIGLAFGRYFRYNPKRVLAALLIDRGHEGSTIELILNKLKKILEAAKRTAPNEMVAVIDELGSATQEAAGDRLGRQVLEKLTGRGVSVIAATQIQSLAEHAESRLGALTCCVDREHKVSRGISDGGLGYLCEEMGLDKLLN